MYQLPFVCAKRQHIVRGRELHARYFALRRHGKLTLWFACQCIPNLRYISARQRTVLTVTEVPEEATNQQPQGENLRSGIDGVVSHV